MQDPLPTIDSRFGARLTIDLAARAANWLDLAGRVAPAECAAVVKADAYGTGLERAVDALARVGARTFFVAHATEGLRVRGRAPAARVFVLNGLPPGFAADFAENDLAPVLGSVPEIEDWADAARMLGRPLACALHVDTGLNRLGLSLAEAAEIAADTRLTSALDVRVLITHLACADEPDHPATARQAERFAEARALFPQARFPGLAASIANSAGIFRDQALHADLVRPGVALYGGAVSTGEPSPMRPVVELEARVIQVRDVAAGDSVGYGAAEHVARPSRVAILSAGYADGYHRLASSSDDRPGGHVAFDGRRAPIVGRLSMDLMAVDVTDMPAVARGTPATLIGPGAALADIARAMGTIDYEVLTSLGRRYERVWREA
jgi:alanine racemase